MVNRNILISTTRQWNPGDEFIAWGVRYLMRQVFPDTLLVWVLYDRNPDLFPHPWESPNRREAQLSNSYSPGRALDVDIAVVAGTPEWHGPHLEPLFDEFQARPVPWLFIGIGHASESVTLTAGALRIIKTALVTTRDHLAASALSSYGVRAPVMPCPSIFGAPLEVPTRQIRRIGLVIQSDRVINQRISSDLKTRTLRLADTLLGAYDVRIICNYIDEFLELSERFPRNLFYSYEPMDYVDVLSTCDFVISTRLHSAFLASSMLKPAVVLNPDPRVTSALRAWPHVEYWTPEEVPVRLNSVDVNLWVRTLLNDKRHTERVYVKLLRTHCEQHGLYC